MGPPIRHRATIWFTGGGIPWACSAPTGIETELASVRRRTPDGAGWGRRVITTGGNFVSVVFVAAGERGEEKGGRRGFKALVGGSPLQRAGWSTWSRWRGGGFDVGSPDSGRPRPRPRLGGFHALSKRRRVGSARTSTPSGVGATVGSIALASAAALARPDPRLFPSTTVPHSK